MSASIRVRSRIPSLAAAPAVVAAAPAPVQQMPPAEAAVVQPVANDTVPVAAAADAQFQRLLQAFWMSNTTANSFAAAAKKDKKALNDWMIGNNVSSDAAFVELANGGRTRVIASIAEGSEEYIDVAKLRKLVSEETFMEIIAATKTKTIAVAGTNIAQTATSTRVTPEALSIKELK